MPGAFGTCSSPTPGIGLTCLSSRAYFHISMSKFEPSSKVSRTNNSTRPKKTTTLTARSVKAASRLRNAGLELEIEIDELCARSGADRDGDRPSRQQQRDQDGCGHALHGEAQSGDVVETVQQAENAQERKLQPVRSREADRVAVRGNERSAGHPADDREIRGAEQDPGEGHEMERGEGGAPG